MGERDNVIALFGMTPVMNYEELVNKTYEKQKVGNNDPYEYYVNNSLAPYPIPYLIFSCVNDNTVYYSIAKHYSEELNNRGSIVLLDTTTSLGAHNVKANPITVGLFTYMGIEYEINIVYSRIADFFSSYNTHRNRVL